ncbi:MAG TPA: PASTA domain-containing protein, partial [Mycobacteriales bacterium]|nr:PASTA domain-containing protein [Mycobacteriales bacterium]
HGDTISLVLSKGPQMVAVPNVQGKKADEARALLDQAGLKTNEFDLLGGGNRVFAQTPDAGTTVKPGSSVTIYVD